MMRPADGLDCVYLYRRPVDMRRSINGLAILVESDMEHNPFDPKLFVFCNTARDKIKILFWERSGFCLYYKRLERDRFHYPQSDADLQITGQQLNWLLDGIDITKIQPHKNRIFKSVL